MGSKHFVARMGLVAAAVILGALLTGSALAQTALENPFTDVHPFNPRSFSGVGLKVLWRTHEPMGPVSVKRVDMLEDLVAVEDTRGFVNIYDRLQGELIVNTYVPGGSEGAISADGRTIYICSGTSLVEINRNTGERSAFDLEFAPSTGVESDDMNLYIGSYNGKFYALPKNTKPETTRPLWRAKWANFSRTLIRGRAFSNALLVFYGSTDGQVTAANISDGSSTWNVKTGFDIIADIVPSASLWHHHDEPAPDPTDIINSPVIYVAGLDGYLYALYTGPRSDSIKEADVKQVKWRFRAGGMMRKPAVVTKDAVYVSAEGRGVISVDNGGKQKWANPLAESFITFGKYVYVTAGKGLEMWALSVEDGTPQWKMDISSFAHAIQNPYDDVIYLVTGDGVVFAVIEQ